MPIKVFIANLTAAILSLFGCSVNKTNYNIDDMYKSLRDQAISIKPSDLKLQMSENEKVFGVLMETGYTEAVASLITMGDGAVSLYFSNGGGMIGIGQHEKPHKLCLEFIKESNKYLKFSKNSIDHILPNKGETIFYFLTVDGIRYFKDKEDNLGNNNSPLSKLFNKAHEIINEARLINEAQKSKKS